jgi:hypothetical protein
MAITTATDISVVLSGGADNLNPNNSIGGSPSLAPISSNILNNLFDDVTSEQNLGGIEDYRCIYFFNDGESTIYNVNVFVSEDYEGGAVMETGIASQNESQRIFITGIPASGSAVFKYDGIPVTINYNSSLATMALNFQNELNSLVDIIGESILENVIVTVQPIGSNIIFDILFDGQDGKRDHPLFELLANNFTPTVTITITTILAGNPINTIAPEIGNSRTPPGGVGFFVSSSVSPISIPKLRSGDGFPLWIKRVVESNTEARSNDGFVLRLQAESLRS